MGNTFRENTAVGEIATLTQQASLKVTDLKLSMFAFLSRLN